MSLRVIQYNEPILRQAGKQVEVFDDALFQLCREMLETMYENDGVGLAAQQIGRAIQLCVIDVPRSRDETFVYRLDGKSPPLELIRPIILINPRVELLPSRETEYLEGCLSFPDINGMVRRPDWVRVRYQDLQGNFHNLRCNGLLGRCVQHEVDHLEGILYIDRMEKPVLKEIEPQLRKLKKKTKKFLKKQRKALRRR
ncbi:MAG: peptide deformylase [Opitutae bacterium]|nr:peptide deformylase [Opitutae bacterium]MBC9889222.1 peptide deformylase [Opitutae bacterium]